MIDIACSLLGTVSMSLYTMTTVGKTMTTVGKALPPRVGTPLRLTAGICRPAPHSEEAAEKCEKQVLSYLMSAKRSFKEIWILSTMT